MTRMGERRKTELAELEIPNAKIERQAFTRDAGGVSMSIRVNDHEARKGVEEPWKERPARISRARRSRVGAAAQIRARNAKGRLRDPARRR